VTDKRVHPLIQFDRRVGKMEYIELAEYGIEPDALFGRFRAHRNEELQSICRNWPQLHIFSEIGDTYVNRFEANADAYFLGRGDTEPSLEVSFKLVYKRENFEKALAELLSRPVKERDEFDNFMIRMTEAVLESDDPFAHSNFRKAMGWE
jgi:hypothetical protein